MTWIRRIPWKILRAITGSSLFHALGQYRGLHTRGVRIMAMRRMFFLGVVPNISDWPHCHGSPERKNNLDQRPKLIRVL